ncbi:MAG: MBL fold metallo-hydrolase [Isosphaeraceae bacterium]
MLGALQPSAAYVVETSAGLVLVDTGLDRDATLLRRQIAALGLDPSRIAAVFLTHAHGDHTGGAAAIRAATGARVHAGKGDAEVLRAGKPREAFFSTFHMPDHEPGPTPVDVELKGGESFSFGDVRVEAIASPGHTPGSVCYLVERHGLRILFGGDVISMLRGDEHPSAPVRKALGTYSAYLPPRYRGDAVTYLESLRKLRALATPDLVLPGHPSGDPIPQSPRFDARRWLALIDEGIHDMEALVARYRDDGADFLDGTPRTILPGLYYLGDYQGVAVYGLIQGPRLFLVNAPGGSGLADFVVTRLREVGVPAATPFGVLLTRSEAVEAAGLPDLCVRFPALRVVVAPSGVAAVRAACPPGAEVVPADSLAARAWFEVETRFPRGRGAGSTAYSLRVEGKSVLFSGRIPMRLGHDAVASLESDLGASNTATLEFLVSVDSLSGLKPDVWLPAVPIDGQNANLYDDDWEQTLAADLREGHRLLRSSR